MPITLQHTPQLESHKMPTTLIFGGSGKVSRLLTQLLVSKSHNVHAIIRNPLQAASITALGANPIVQSIEPASVSDLAATLRRVRPDVVVWSAGAGGGDPARTEAVDHIGAIKAMDACAEAGVRRYIVVSAVDIRDRSLNVPEWYDADDEATGDKMWASIGAYCKAKLAADKALVQDNARRGLQWTIVRPGGLTEEKGKGTVSAGKVHITATVAREDVAAVVAACIENQQTAGCCFDVVGGGEDIVTAVARIARDKVNTFEGYCC